MADINGEILKPRVDTQISEGFKAAVRELKSSFIDSNANNEVMTLDEMHSKVLAWELENEDKVRPEEIDALESLSLILGNVKFNLEHRATNRELLMRESLNTQREIVKTVFNNLNEDGKPNSAITRIFGLITCVFERYFDPNDLMITGKGVYRESGIWQGVMGMVTAAVMFNREGWEIRFPPVDLDINHEVDLIVKNPKGEIFAVDVTSRLADHDDAGGIRNGEFSLTEVATKHPVYKAIDGLTGTIRLNIPPIYCREAENFYEDKMSGYPSSAGFEKFTKAIQIENG